LYLSCYKPAAQARQVGHCPAKLFTDVSLHSAPPTGSGDWWNHTELKADIHILHSHDGAFANILVTLLCSPTRTFKHRLSIYGPASHARCMQQSVVRPPTFEATKTRLRPRIFYIGSHACTTCGGATPQLQHEYDWRAAIPVTVVQRHFYQLSHKSERPKSTLLGPRTHSTL
jgi:hypothetical protein